MAPLTHTPGACLIHLAVVFFSINNALLFLLFIAYIFKLGPWICSSKVLDKTPSINSLISVNYLN